MGDTGIGGEQLLGFARSLAERERAAATVEKYTREAALLARYIGDGELTKGALLAYRETLRARHRARTVNGKLSAVNAFLNYLGRLELALGLLRVQRRAFVEDGRELGEAEFRRLLAAARAAGNERLYHVMLAVCGTGIRISELKYITVEAVRRGRAEISMKGKERLILIPKELRRRLAEYAAAQGIGGGCLFVTRSGRPLDRSNVCHDMKKLCRAARVDERRVFPHNLRHLFARCFYAVEKDLAHLADILGHSSIETTRIYVATSARECERTMAKMRLVI